MLRFLCLSIFSLLLLGTAHVAIAAYDISAEVIIARPFLVLILAIAALGKSMVHTAVSDLWRMEIAR